MARLSIAWSVAVLAVAVIASGCRRELPAEPIPVRAAAKAQRPRPPKPQAKIVTGSIVNAEPAVAAPAPAAAAAAPAPEAAIVGSAAWCAQRHVDATEGRAPAGATIIAQKEAHDGICEQQRTITGNQ